MVLEKKDVIGHIELTYILFVLLFVLVGFLFSFDYVVEEFVKEGVESEGVGVLEGGVEVGVGSEGSGLGRDGFDGDEKKSGFFKRIFEGLFGKEEVLFSPPSIDSVSPLNGLSKTGEEQIFTIEYSDPEGWEDLIYGYVIFGADSSDSRIFLEYRHTTKFGLVNDKGIMTYHCDPESDNFLSNSYVKLDCSKSFVSGSGDTMTLTLALTFKEPFIGNWKILLRTKDISDKDKGKWVPMGDWDVEEGEVIIVPVKPLPQMRALYGGINELRIGEGGIDAYTDMFRSYGINTFITKHSGLRNNFIYADRYPNSPENFYESILDQAEWAEQKGFVFFPIIDFVHRVNDPDDLDGDEITVSSITDNYVVFSDGSAGSQVTPFDETYWDYLTDIAVRLARLSENYGKYRVDGLMFDFELYKSVEFGEPRKFDRTFGFEDSTFNNYLVDRGLVELNSPPKESNQRAERYDWLIDNGRWTDYYSYLEDTIEKLAENMKSEVRKVNPDFVLGFYPTPEPLYLIDILDGFGSEDDPAVLLDTFTYAISYMGYSYGGEVVPTGISRNRLPSGYFDVTKRYHPERNKPAYAYYLGGTIAAAYDPLDYENKLYNIGNDGNGYWIYQATFFLNGFRPDLPGWGLPCNNGIRSFNCPNADAHQGAVDHYLNEIKNANLRLGWEPCVLSNGGDEICDNKDNDCNGKVDDGDLCDNGNYCDGVETCSSGSCVDGSAVVCNDGIDCTDDFCDEVNDKCDVDESSSSCGCPNGLDSECSNDDVCDGIESCNTETLVCIDDVDLDCDGSDVCIDYSCDAVLGCQESFNSADCNDGVDCTLGDKCNLGDCSGTPYDSECEFFWQSCNPVSGCEQASCKDCKDCDTWLGSCSYNECHNECDWGDGCYFEKDPLGDDCVPLSEGCSSVGSCGDYSVEECVSDLCDKAPVGGNGCELGENRFVIMSFSQYLDDFADEWHQLVQQTYIQNEKVINKIYIDGVLRNTEKFEDAGGLVNNYANLKLAVDLNGEVDDVKIWNRALSSSEVLDDNNGVLVSDSLIAHYNFNEGSGVGVVDSVGDNDGVLNGDAVRIDGGIIDIGTSGYIEIKETSVMDISLTDEYTISGRFKLSSEETAGSRYFWSDYSWMNSGFIAIIFPRDQKFYYYNTHKDLSVCVDASYCGDGVCGFESGENCGGCEEDCGCSGETPHCSSGNCVECERPSDCDDGLYCNGVESCVDGSCVDGSVINFDDRVGCTMDSCDEVNDVIVNVVDDGLCQNGDWCDGVESCDAVLDCQDEVDPDCSDVYSCSVDSCSEGSVVGDNLGVCDYDTSGCGCLVDGDCDDSNDCTDDFCNAQRECDKTNKINGFVCDDGNLCTEDDKCSVGVCSGSARDCSSLSDQCNDGVCDLDDGLCKAEVKINGLSCDDGLFCSVSDVCGNGVCGGSSRDCSSFNDQCNDGVCDDVLNLCKADAKVNGLDCDDEVDCTVEDKCSFGDCKGRVDDNECEDWESCNPVSDCGQVTCSSCKECDSWLSGCDYNECHNECDWGDGCYFDSKFGENCVSLVDGCSSVDSCEDYSSEECVSDLCGKAPSSNGCELDGDDCVAVSYCGDGVCDVGSEDCSSCVEDCSCSGNVDLKQCSSGSCVECLEVDDCDDDKSCTNDLCTNNVCVFPEIDSDGDGYGACLGIGFDCDDGDRDVNPGVEESCNNVDDDCDGLTDESLSQATSCGVGLCLGNVGVETCSLGSWIGDTCDEDDGAVDEVCNNADDDCDGSTDEGCACSLGDTQPCGSDVGECVAGSQVCDINGIWGDCVGGQGPVVEICDNKDNDCSNGIDDGLSRGTSCGVGACSGNSGVETCSAGVWGSDTCDDKAGAVSDANCNGVDDDCDGSKDEDYVSVDTSCGVGECLGNSGSWSCVSGNEVDSCDEYAGKVEESCDDETGFDGLDNNCDGNVDLDCESICDKDGDGYTNNLICLPACLIYGWNCLSLDCDDSNVNINPREDELCNGIDDDCDGGTSDGVDEDWFGDETGCGVGECAAVGEQLCINSQKTNTCQEGVAELDDKSCDGKDNDCSGDADEDYISLVTDCGINECLRIGITSCSNGEVLDSCVVGTSELEICDGKDNDCDGKFDEGCDCLLGDSQPCGSDVGECVVGLQTCNINGNWGDCVGGQGPVEEICDGLDNNCVGGVDEGGNSLCDDSIDCTDDVCNGVSECSYTENHGLCENNLFCDGEERCSIDEEKCISIKTPNCEDVFSCTDDSCDEGLDKCVSDENSGNCLTGQICDVLNFVAPTGCGYVENCVDKDGDGLYDYDENFCSEGVDECSGTNKGYFVRNPFKLNDYLPKVGKFNIPSVNAGNILNFENFSVEYNGTKINFVDNVSLVKVNASGCFEVINLSEIVLFEDGKLSVNTSLMDGFDKPALLKFSGINFENPQIYRDDVKCVDCEIINYSKGEFLEVMITGFVSYDVKEGAYCGDGVCNGGDSCSNCVVDCGVCSAGEGGILGGGSGSSGGGGGGSPSGPSGPSGGNPSGLNINQSSVVNVSYPSSCVETWSCKDWSECNESVQRRECSDVNDCGSEEYKPILEKECVEKNNVIKLAVAFFISFFVSGIVAVLIVVYFKIRDRRKSVIRDLHKNGYHGFKW
ncbi:hypothetical protein HOE04_01425 [archaeon]|jgi:hypothetical protein|nr:hypothetical protein [archaeon]